MSMISTLSLHDALPISEYASWRSLRDSEDAKYIALTMPRFLSRIPDGSKTAPVEEFAFEEDTEGADHSKYVDRKRTRLNSSHVSNSYAVYCLKKKTRHS